MKTQRKTIIATLAISLCALVAGVAALVSTPLSEGNTSQASGYFTVNVSSNDDSMGNVYVNVVNFSKSTSYGAGARTEYTANQNLKTINVYNNFNETGSVTVTLKAVPKSGYRITGWKVNSVLYNTKSDVYSVTSCCNSGDDYDNVQVIFALDPSAMCSLKVEIENGGYILSGYGNRQVVKGERAYLKAVAYVNYTFKEWKITSGTANATIYNPTSSTLAYVIMTGDATVKACIQNDTVYSLTTSVSPNSSAGTITRSISAQSGSNGYYSGTAVTLTAEPNVGYEIDEWEITQGGITTTYNASRSRSITMTADTSVVVRFVKNTYALTAVASPSAGGTVLRNVVKSEYNRNENVVLTAAAEIGYTHTGWSVVRTGMTTLTYGAVTNITVNMQANTRVTATFVKKTYTLSGTGFSRSPNQTLYDHGTSVRLMAGLSAGQEVSNWVVTVNGVSTTYPSSLTLTITMIGNTTVVPNIKDTVHSLNIVIQTYHGGTLMTSAIGGSVSKSPSANTYQYGTAVTLTANPASGYQVMNWVVTRNGSSTTYSASASRSVTITVDTEVTVSFERKTYTLSATASPGAGGAVSRDVVKSNYNHGEDVVLTAVAETGYEITGWTVTRTGLSTLTHGAVTSITVNMQANTSVVANFSKKTYTLHGSNFTRNPNRTIYEHGTEVVLTATVPTGQEVTGWTVTQNGTIANYPASSTLTITMLGETTVVPNFQVKKYDVSASIRTYDGSTVVSLVGGSVSRSVSGTSVAHGTEITFTATAREGFEILGWEITRNGVTSTVSASGSTASQTLAITSDTTVVAKFAKMYTIEVG